MVVSGDGYGGFNRNSGNGIDNGEDDEKWWWWWRSWSENEDNVDGEAGFIEDNDDRKIIMIKGTKYLRDKSW